MRFFLNRDAALSLVGVPRAQRFQIESQYEGGLLKYLEDQLEAVFCRLPIADNYFWRVYMHGQYSPRCCPEYLKAENFEKLKGGLVDRISVHSATVEQFLRDCQTPISRYVLLDHMDWLSTHDFAALEAEWQMIFDRAAPGARAIWRSGGLKTDFVDRVKVRRGGEERQVSDLVTYHRDLAASLHEMCRVHTYASFHIADLNT